MQELRELVRFVDENGVVPLMDKIGFVPGEGANPLMLGEDHIAVHHRDR
jgi:hypothetical protein